MKTKLTFALMAILTSTAFAAFQAPLPEFKNEKQLAEWRAEMAAKDTPQTTTENTAFYTGKPYLESTNSYAFKYRSYNPELARWTSEDPSGFPDGANGSNYAPTPTHDLDVAGLLKWSTLTNKNMTETAGPNIVFDVWTVKTNDESATITLWKYKSGATGGSDYTYNCHGYTFGKSQYWINGQVDDMLKGDGFKKIEGTDKTGAKIAYWGSNIHTATVGKVEGGVVTEVTGKQGAGVILTSTPAGQGYTGTINYYE